MIFQWGDASLDLQQDGAEQVIIGQFLITATLFHDKRQLLHKLLIARSPENKKQGRSSVKQLGPDKNNTWQINRLQKLQEKFKNYRRRQLGSLLLTLWWTRGNLATLTQTVDLDYCCLSVFKPITISTYNVHNLFQLGKTDVWK